MSSTRGYVFKLNCNCPRVLICALLVAFVVRPLSAQSYQALYNFDCTAGCGPSDYGHLVQGTDGYLYGTTGGGGASNKGTIFKINTTGTSIVDLHDFNGTSDGYSPAGALTLAAIDGNYYGTTIGGGTFNNGTLFSYNPATTAFAVLHNFTATETSTVAAPVEGLDQNLYGTTQSGSTYTVKFPGPVYKALPGTAPKVPNAPLLAATDGYLYGTSQLGGTNNLGTVFRMTTAGKITILHSFNGSDGSTPASGLIQAKDGSLYGTTSFQGGTADAGTVFRIVLTPLSFSTVHAFDGTNGNGPVTSLLQATDGNFYGTTTYGGLNSVGTIYDISGGVFNKLFDFADEGESGASGAYPHAALMQHTNGVFYGLTEAGGTDFEGVFYSVTPLNVNLTITLCCNLWVILDQPVTILGQNLTEAINVSFGSVQAVFQPGSDTFLTAQVPTAAIDAPITVTLATGLQLQSQQTVHIRPKITNLDPSSGAVGSQVNITGGGFTGTSKVTFGGVSTGNFAVLSPSLIQATVPSGAKTGKVNVTAPNGQAVSKQTFTVH